MKYLKEKSCIFLFSGEMIVVGSWTSSTMFFILQNYNHKITKNYGFHAARLYSDKMRRKQYVVP